MIHVTSLKKTLKSIRDAHREQTKNFGKFMAFLWAFVGWAFLFTMLIVLAICLVNPLWFRQSLLGWVTSEFPEDLRALREFMFKRYKSKMNLFDTIKG